MDYKEFACAVEKQIKQKMKGGVKASLYTVVKNNGKERTGVLIETPGVNISPTIYLEEYYESYLEGKPLEYIVGELTEFYESIRKGESWDCNQILTYNGVKDRIVFKLINTAKNRKFLDSVPHRMFLDLSIVFYVLFEGTEEGTAVMTVSNRHAKQWNVGTEELWEDAVKNAGKLLPAELMTMKSALKDMVKKSDDCKENAETENLLAGGGSSRDRMYVLSNNLRNYGAACIAYPHIMETIGEILQEDYYILPSSVHEVVIVPYSKEISRGEMDNMVRDINETQVADEEVLSDHAYLYDIRMGCLRRGTEFMAGGVMG